LLSEWVLIAAWTDPEDGHSWRTYVSPPPQPLHHNKGLLWEGLYWEFETP
jgi:hypothetical protein